MSQLSAPNAIKKTAVTVHFQPFPPGHDLDKVGIKAVIVLLDEVYHSCETLCPTLPHDSPACQSCLTRWYKEQLQEYELLELTLWVFPIE